MAMCIYINCSSVQKPFSSLTFFALPKDHRRPLWIENSGNTELATLPVSARRVVCQKHFNPSSLRVQFHRTTLSKDAVPVRWDDNSSLIDSFLEPIEIADNRHNHETDTHSQDKMVQIDDDCDDQNLRQDENEWHNEDGSITVDEADDIEFVEAEHDPFSQSVDFCAAETNHSNDIEETNGEKTNLSHDRFPQFIHEEEIQTADTKQTRTTETVKECTTDGASDVSSSTNKSNDIVASGSIHISNEEDKYFALTLIGMLQRISPQKKAFAKVNILRYLTELEYGIDATIK